MRGQKNGETRAFSVDRHEDRIRAQARTVVSVGEREALITVILL